MLHFDCGIKKIFLSLHRQTKQRSKMIKGYSFKLAVRFGSDYKIPIAVYDNVESFEYELNLYEKAYGALTKWNELVKNIERYYNGDNETFLSEYHNVRENIIATTLNSDIYKQFNTCKDPIDMVIDDVDRKQHEKMQLSPMYGKSIYNQENIGRRLISIDLRNANFQALKYINVISGDTYRDFLSQFCSGFMLDYIIESKYSRQVIFGKLDPKRTIAIEKFLIKKIYYIVKDEYNYMGTLLYFGSDELIFSYDESIDMNAFLSSLRERIQKEGLDVRIEDYVLYGYEFFVKKADSTEHKLGEFYRRSCDDGGKYKGMPLPYHKILTRLINDETPTDIDKELMHEKVRARMIDDIIVKKRD